MARLIEIQASQPLPTRLVVSPGDVLVFDASGGRLGPGADNVELLGSFVRSVVGDGSVLSPMGGPNAVVIRACRAGSARVHLVIGDPWSAPSTHELLIVVDE